MVAANGDEATGAHRQGLRSRTAVVNGMDRAAAQDEVGGHFACDGAVSATRQRLMVPNRRLAGSLMMATIQRSGTMRAIDFQTDANISDSQRSAL